MKRHLFTLLFLFLIIGTCFADGCMMLPPDYTEKVFIPEQKAVIFWDGTTEQLVIESKITLEDVGNVAWLIPIESSTKPEIETADEFVFFELSDLFTPMIKNRGSGLWQTMGAEGGLDAVEVIEQLKLDIYDITILRTTDETALIEWLNQNGYAFPEAFPNLLSQYVKSGNFYFIANKINLENKYPGIDPTTQDFECAQRLSDLDSIRYNYYSSSLLEDRIPSLMERQTDCEGADREAVTALVKLRVGISTPLKITFTPQTPFYPMKISSLNLGEGHALVYFVSDSPYRDSTGLFSEKGMLTVKSGDLSEYGINQGDYITMLIWQDSYPLLQADSFFVKTPFVPTLDPNYVPLEQVILEAIFPLLFILLISGFLSIQLALIPFILGFVITYIFQESKKKKGLWAKSNGLFGLITSAVLVLLGPLFLIVVFVLPVLFFRRSSPEMLLSGLFFMLLFLLPYYASMVCGFLFRRSKHKKRWILGPVIIFAVIAILAFISMGVIIS